MRGLETVGHQAQAGTCPGVEYSAGPRGWCLGKQPLTVAGTKTLPVETKRDWILQNHYWDGVVAEPKDNDQISLRLHRISSLTTAPEGILVLSIRVPANQSWGDTLRDVATQLENYDPKTELDKLLNAGVSSWQRGLVKPELEDIKTMLMATATNLHMEAHQVGHQ